MVMNIVLYGVSAEIAGKIAGKYGLKLISTPDKFQPSGTVVLVPPMGGQHGAVLHAPGEILLAGW